MSLAALSASIVCTGILLAASHWARRKVPAWVKRMRRSKPRAESLDTVGAWLPEPTRVLNVHEIEALELARRAAPGAMLLAQVPLARFLRVPTRHSYARWLARVGQLNADILVCDARSEVLAVVDVRSATASERSRRRHDRMQRVLRAAGISVLVWQQDNLPTITAARAQFSALGVPAGTQERARATAPPPDSEPIPLEPRGLMAQLAEGDEAAARRKVHDPVPSDFHDLPSLPLTLH